MAKEKEDESKYQISEYSFELAEVLADLALGKITEEDARLFTLQHSPADTQVYFP